MRVDGAAAVLLHGSVVRGQQRPDSDIDLLVVTDDNRRQLPRHQALDGFDVEAIVGTSSEWQGRLDRDQPTLTYAWAEARPLDDPAGVGATLVKYARNRLDTYTTPDIVRQNLRQWWQHVAPKLAASRDRTDVEAGIAAAISLDKIIETLFAVNNRPNPPAASTPRRLALLTDLTVPAGLHDLFAAATTGTAHQRAHACLQLIDQTPPLLDRPAEEAAAET